MANQGFWTANLEATTDNLDGLLLQYLVAASRPAASQVGRDFIASDTKVYSRDNGAGWDTVIDVDAVVATPSFRTLGTGAQQAAAGDHGHT